MNAKIHDDARKKFSDEELRGFLETFFRVLADPELPSTVVPWLTYEAKFYEEEVKRNRRPEPKGLVAKLRKALTPTSDSDSG